jgi:prephenate dehydrogenase
VSTLGIIGTGLIGGSIGLRARELGLRVIGYDADPQAAEEAVRCGVLDESVPLAQVDERADIIVIGAHINGTIAHLERMRDAPPRNARLILDIASVKAPIVRAAHGLRNFVATHPMAGRERSGPAAAISDLFEGKTWLYVPTDNSELDVHAATFIREFGATPVPIDAVEHDRTVAFTSHLPQIIATLFAKRKTTIETCPRDVSNAACPRDVSNAACPRDASNAACPRDASNAACHPKVSNAACHPEVSKDGRGIEALAGPVARELLRLSRSSPAMWHDILEANRGPICEELRGLASAMERVASDLEHGENLYPQGTTPAKAVG